MDEVGERHIWWHSLTVIVPDELKYEDHALIWVSDNDNDDNDDTGVPDRDDEFIIATTTIASGLGMVVALLNQVSHFTAHI